MKKEEIVLTEAEERETMYWKKRDERLKMREEMEKAAESYAQKLQQQIKKKDER